MIAHWLTWRLTKSVALLNFFLWYYINLPNKRLNQLHQRTLSLPHSVRLLFWMTSAAMFLLKCCRCFSFAILFYTCDSYVCSGAKRVTKLSAHTHMYNVEKCMHMYENKTDNNAWNLMRCDYTHGWNANNKIRQMCNDNTTVKNRLQKMEY